MINNPLEIKQINEEDFNAKEYDFFNFRVITEQIYTQRLSLF